MVSVSSRINTKPEPFVHIMSSNFEQIYVEHPDWFGEWYEPAVMLILLIALVLIIPYIYIELFEDYVKQLIRKR